MSLMDKIKSMFAGGSADATDSHAGHDHANHDHADHDHAADDHSPQPAGTVSDEGDNRLE